jgi:hypothetical protein
VVHLPENRCNIIINLADITLLRSDEKNLWKNIYLALLVNVHQSMVQLNPECFQTETFSPNL